MISAAFERELKTRIGRERDPLDEPIDTEIVDWALLLLELTEAIGWADASVTSIYRSAADQQRLVQSGQTKTAPNFSTHNWGLAFDLYVPDVSRQRQLGEFGEQLGLVWGGRFREPDPVHFQIVDPGEFQRFVTKTMQRRFPWDWFLPTGFTLARDILS